MTRADGRHKGQGLYCGQGKRIPIDYYIQNEHQGVDGRNRSLLKYSFGHLDGPRWFMMFS